MVDEANVKMVVTDLDGTLLNRNSKLSAENRNTLLHLGRIGIMRVVATGRNYFSFQRLGLDDLPIDYLVFSSGAGIMDYRSKKILHHAHIPMPEVALIIEILKNMKISFMVHDLVPDNHRFYFYDSGRTETDFHQRIELYRDYALPLRIDPPNFSHACQVLAIIPPDLEMLENLRDKLNLFRVIRTTSPINGKSMWVEIFPHDVSKGHGVSWICRELSIYEKECIGIGNDFNDLDLLETVGFPFVVENAPEELKMLFPASKSNIEDGFTHAVCSVIKNMPG